MSEETRIKERAMKQRYAEEFTGPIGTHYEKDLDAKITYAIRETARVCYALPPREIRPTFPSAFEEEPS
jgi:hypothetical protein